MAGYAIIIYHDELNQMEFVAELISTVFGYEKSQALNCAYLVCNRGEYLIRRFSASQKGKAEACLNALSVNGIPAELLRT